MMRNLIEANVFHERLVKYWQFCRWLFDNLICFENCDYWNWFSDFVGTAIMSSPSSHTSNTWVPHNGKEIKTAWVGMAIL
jgi:hypothetical protein